MAYFYFKVIISLEASGTFRKLDNTVKQRIAVLVDRTEASINPAVHTLRRPDPARRNPISALS